MTTLYQERNIVNAGLASGAAIMDQIMDTVDSFYEPFYPYFLLAVLLIAADTWWGVRKSKMKGEEVRRSRMGRKAFNKFVDYFCWVTIAALLGSTFGTILGIPSLAAIVLGFVYAIELDSCIGNFFYVKGFKKKISLFGYLSEKIGLKIEDEDDINSNKTTDK